MNDSGGVCSRQCTGDLNGNIQRFSESEWLFIYQLTQCLAVNELGGDEMRGVRLPNLMYRNDVWVI